MPYQFPFPETFDNTMLSTFCTCHRKFYWFSRRVFTSEEPAYFAFGRAFGAGVNAWHEGQGKHKEEYRETQMMLAARKEWNKSEPVEEYGDNTWDNLSGLLSLYAKIYGPEERWTPAYATGELGFTFPIPGTPWSYGGSMDQPIVWEGYGLMLREDKTTGGYITPAYMAQWDYASQVTGYLWAFSVLRGEVPFGALINVASKRKRKDESLRFGRRIVEHSEWLLSEFIEDTIKIIREIERCYDANSFPMTGMRDPINCTGGMGRSACIYKDLCLLETPPDEITDEELIASGYVIKPPWEPWKREGENE